MSGKVVPMIHVPDVRATVNWYESIGFTVTDTYDDGDEGLSFAILRFGNSEVMFNSGGQPSSQKRREVDLYIYVDNVDDVYRNLKDRVENCRGAPRHLLRNARVHHSRPQPFLAYFCAIRTNFIGTCNQNISSLQFFLQ